MKELVGTGVALITPFTDDNKIDTQALHNLVNYVIEGGVDYIVALGTTSEVPTLSPEEKKLVCQTIIKANNKRVPLVIGIGGNNTQSVINEIKTTDLSDFVAILSVVPYYNKPNQNGIYAHFSQIAQNSPLPLIVYNVPGRVGVSMSAETTKRLATDFKNIVAIKEASGDLNLNMLIIKDKPKEFTFLSGDDMSALPSIYMGGSGVISVVGMAFPKEFSQMIRLGLKAEVEKANAIHYGLIKSISLAFKEGNPVGIKAILAQKGLCKSHVRLPLCEASDALKVEIKAHIG